MRGKHRLADARVQDIRPDGVRGAAVAQRGASFRFRQHEPQARVALNQQVAQRQEGRSDAIVYGGGA